MIVVNKGQRKSFIIGTAVWVYNRLTDKEKEKVGKYQDLKKEIQKIWNMRSCILDCGCTQEHHKKIR